MFVCVYLNHCVSGIAVLWLWYAGCLFGYVTNASDGYVRVGGACSLLVFIMLYVSLPVTLIRVGQISVGCINVEYISVIYISAGYIIGDFTRLV